MDKCCALFGYSRQAYYKHSAVKDFDTEAANELILQSVSQHREMMPRIGSRKLYVLAQQSRGVSISMTESGDPLENAEAERVNGIIKSEWLNNVEIKDLADCLCHVEKAIDVYNNVRPHLSLNYQTPAQAHRQSGSQKRCWKTWSERRNERLLQSSRNVYGAEVKAIVDGSTIGSDENALRH